MPKSDRGMCKADIEKFCKDIKPDGGRLWACLKNNTDQLSKECKDHVAKAREKTRQHGSDHSAPGEE
jgi:hypothetical protein